MVYADLHAHSFLCAFQQRLQEKDPMSRNPNDEYSVWHQFPMTHNLLYTLGEKVGFTTYSESDFTQSVLNGVKLVNVALYPPERGFFKLSDKTFWEKIVKWVGLDNWVETEMGHYISGFSIRNVDHIKSFAYEYFTELIEQAGYITNTAPFAPDPAGCIGTVYSNIKNASYVLRKTGADLSASLTDELIQVILSVEGAMLFGGIFTMLTGRYGTGQTLTSM